MFSATLQAKFFLYCSNVLVRYTRHTALSCAHVSTTDDLNDETFGDGGDFDEEGHLPSFFGAAGDEEFSALMDDLKQTALQGLEADDEAAVFANGTDAAATAAGSDFFSTVGAMSALSLGGPSAQQQARPQQTFAAPTSADAKAEWSVMQKQFEVRALMLAEQCIC